MSSFRDKAAREWTIDIDLAAVEQLRKSTIAINLFDLVEKDAAAVTAARLNDVMTLGEVVFLLIKPQAEKLGVSEASFKSQLGGDVFDAMGEALEKAIVDFFPTRQRPTLQAALTKQRELEAKSVAHQLKILQSPRTDQLIEQALERASETALAELERKLLPPAAASSATG